MTLNQLLVRNQIVGNPFVVVPDELAWGAGVPSDAHPCHWIPRLDERPPACGEAKRLTDEALAVWCLRAEDHVGPHW